ncbi:alkaline phosphatase family protein [Paenibacillus mendelii]|uniref:Alkaline phosphatase family protein n=1 Tax=Paenibacillus mendelii TaxID=206163 RepID=A0ABV6J619_9BACL|nr:alkaline phosphatase family protein [Paenibacillus mendelii]MCQ6559973.1 alkaline phosphatase family protein [Paenibacillus mendelii]
MNRHLKRLAVSSIAATVLLASAQASVLPVYAQSISSGEDQTAAFSQAISLSPSVLDLKFDNDAADSSASAVSATVYGNPEYVQGRLGQAIQFQTRGQYVDLGNRDEFRFGDAADFSVAFWFKSSGITGDPSIISNKDWNSGSNTGWILAVNGSGNLVWNYKTSQSARMDTTVSGVADNNWHHIAVSHDRVNGIARFYKDGALVKTVDISGMKGTLDSSYTTKIGQDGTGKYGSTLTARVDDLQIYRNALTDAEVSAMFDSAPPLPPTPVASVSLDRSELDLKAGAPMPLTATVYPDDATIKEVEWLSSDDTVAKVETINGRPTVVAGKAGNATLTVKTVDGGKTATAVVRVSNSIDVSGDGLLTKEDLNLVLKNQNSREGDNRWARAQTADINGDRKVDHDDVQIVRDRLVPYKDTFLYKRVVFIGIDGAGNGVKDPQANAQNIQKLMSEGAGTYEAKAMLPTISAQNWGSILHGVIPAKHGLTNDVAAGKPYPENNLYPSYMKMLKQERPMLKQASFATWSPINKGIIEDSAGAYKVNGGNDETTTQKTVDYIKAEGHNARNIFVHLDEVDGAGHNYGYYTPKFYEKLQNADQYVGRIVQALEDAGLMEDTLIILTADHGGKGTGHGGNSLEEQTVFWAAKGKSIAAGTVLSDDVSVVDTAAVVAHALRLEIPEDWDAKIPAGLFQDKKQ